MMRYRIKVSSERMMRQRVKVGSVPVMTNATDYGTLTDHTTGNPIRPATRDEWLRSLRAGETGAYRDDDGRDVYVAGGYESEADERADA